MDGEKEARQRGVSQCICLRGGSRTSRQGDEQINAVVKRAYARYPNYVVIIRVCLLGGATVSAALLTAAGLSALHATEIGVHAGAAFALLWHLAFVNTVLFQLTSEEMQAG